MSEFLSPTRPLLKTAANTLASAALLFWTGGAVSQTVDTQRLETLEQEYMERDRARVELEKTSATREREAGELQERLVEAAAQLQAQEQEASRIERRLNQLTQDEARIETRLATQQESLSEVLAALQELELSKPPALAVTPEDASQAARAAMLLSAAAPELQERAEALTRELDALREVRVQIETQQNALSAAKSDLNERRNLLADLLVKKRREQTEAQKALARTQKELAALASQASSMRELITRLERRARDATPRLKPNAAPRPRGPSDAEQPAHDDARIAALPRPAPRRESQSVDTAPAFTPNLRFAEARGRLQAPVAGFVAAQFGQKTENGSRSEGVVFSTRESGVVTAPFDGQVVFARSKKPMGNVLILDVGDGYHIVMIGVSRYFCVESQFVLAGEPIAAMAGGDPTEPPQLYMEIRKDREPINPANWFAPDSLVTARG